MYKVAAFALFLSGIPAALPLEAQPELNSIENNYSYIPPGLPNYGIAQGSIFVIFGTGLASTSSPLQSVPLKTTLDGVSVQFSVQGTTTQALLYYVSPTQIGGILPSATPTGSGTVTVTNGPQTSAAISFTVVQSAVGLLTLGFPSGPANASDGGKQLFPGAYAANPGDTVTFYGTGAGPVSGDESVLQTPQNLSNIPLEIDIGGIPATVSYHGRSIYPGLDQFNVVVPPGALGCNVSVAARSGAFTSNTATIAVASGGRVCTDNLSGVTILSTSATATGSTLDVGGASLSVSTSIQPSSSSATPTVFVTSGGGAAFTQFTTSPGEGVSSGSPSPTPSMGGCSVVTSASPVTPPPPPTTTTSPTPGITILNAGPELNFTGPNGVASIQRTPSGSYSGPLSLITGQVFVPPSGGTFTLDNGAGGPDIGPFHQTIAFPPPLTLTNAAAIGASIDRTKPLTVQWTGGDPTSFVTVVGSSGLPVPTSGPQAGIQVNVGFTCTTPASAGQFTVPSWVLMALPAQAAKPLPAVLQIRTEYAVPFSPGVLAAAQFEALSAVELLVSYQ